jgi:hypothetical protein
MKRIALVALLAAALGIAAQESQPLGDSFPVTNTRYRAAFGTPYLTTNGRDFFLFWTADQRTRATRLRDDEPRTGHVIFDTRGALDVVWTGTQFVAYTGPNNSVPGKIVGRLLDEEARPIGAPFTVTDKGYVAGIAAGTDSIAILYYDSVRDRRLLVMDTDGKTVLANRRFSGTASAAIAANGDGFMIVTRNETGLVVTRLDRLGETVSVHNRDMNLTSVSELRLAVEGSSSLAVWCENGQTLKAAPIDADGNIGAVLTAVSAIPGSAGRSRHLGAVWNGSGWTLTYESFENDRARSHVVQLDWSAHTVLSHEHTDAGIGDPSIAVLGERVMAAWSASSSGAGTSVVELPIAANPPRIATWAATEQTLLTTASSAEGTLFVWKETNGGVTTSVRSGVRTHDGHWTEHEIARNADNVRAASNGRQFAILFNNALGKSEVALQDENGQALMPNIVLPVRAKAIAGNASHFAVINDVSSQNATLISLSGAVSPAVSIGPRSFTIEHLVSDGNGFLAVGPGMTCAWSCWPNGVRVRRLGADLHRIGTQDPELFDKPVTLAGARWNGSEYVVVWTAEGRTLIARVSPSPAVPTEMRSASAPFAIEDFAAMRDGSIAIVGRPTGAAPRIVVLSAEGEALRTLDIESVALTGGPRLAALAGGAFAYVSSSVQDAAPHHGTSHVMMAISRPSIVPVPDAPLVKARIEGSLIAIDWTAPVGTLNGYRVEYRVDDGSWNELEQWFSPSAHHTAIRQPSFGTNFAIRMRAFNDGGASEYSAIASTKPNRRRAVH